jgi:hypothetical protein
MALVSPVWVWGVGSGDGQWAAGNGQWGMGSGEWGMGNEWKFAVACDAGRGHFQLTTRYSLLTTHHSLLAAHITP